MNQINATRSGAFMRRQAIMNIQSFWIGIGAVTGFLFLVTLLVYYFSPNQENLKGLYLTVFFILGLILTSRMFTELHRPQQSYAFLTLPASTLEKLAGTWAISSPGYVVVYFLFMYMVILLSALVTGGEFSPAYFFDKDTWRTIGVFMVIQPVFLVGACTFRGNNFLKTIFALFVFSLFIMVVSGILVYLFLPWETGTFIFIVPGFESYLSEYFLPVIHFLFWYALAPFMLVVSYFKLKARQVN